MSLYFLHLESINVLVLIGVLSHEYSISMTTNQNRPSIFFAKVFFSSEIV